jgi:hypothetical protein
LDCLVEKTISNYEINRVILSIEKLKTRLNLIERWNMTNLYDRLHKLKAALSTDRVRFNIEGFTFFNIDGIRCR